MVDKKKTSTHYAVYEGEVYYAKVHEQNMDDSDFHEKTQGQFNMTFVPTAYYNGMTKEENRVEAPTEEIIERMCNHDGYPRTSMGHEMIRPLKAAGERLSVKLKRPNVHPKFEDMGGAPVVQDWTNGVSDKLWDYDVDGSLGNGTKVQVKVSYFRDIVRLERMAVLEHVPFELSEMQELGW